MLTEQREPVGIPFRGPGESEKRGRVERVRIAHVRADRRAGHEGSRGSESRLKPDAPLHLDRGADESRGGEGRVGSGGVRAGAPSHRRGGGGTARGSGGARMVRRYLPPGG